MGDSIKDPLLPSQDTSSQEDNEYRATLLPDPPRKGMQYRYLTAAMGFLGFFNVYAMRVNLSVAIVEMSDHFNWTKHQQGVILGSFFYGYICTQLAGGVLATRYGGKWVYGIGVLCTSVLTLLTPVVASRLWLLLILRILEGVGEGVTFPSTHALLSKWANPKNRSFLGSIAFSGCYLGTVIAQPISGYLCAWKPANSTLAQFASWKSVFYCFGLSGILWFILWSFLVYNSPEEHPYISKEEKEYIQSTIAAASRSSRDLLQKKDGFRELPWHLFFSNMGVWACVVEHTSSNWAFYTLLTCLPTYLKDVLDFDIKKAGLIASIPYLAQFIVSFSSGIIADYLRFQRILTTTRVRKLMTTICNLVTGGFFLMCAYAKSETTAILSLALALGTSGAGQAGFNVNQLDLSPKYAGILMGITNTFATIPGFLGPLVADFLTPEKPSRSEMANEWRVVFYISTGILFFGWVFYMKFGSGEPQGFENYVRDSSEDEKAPAASNTAVGFPVVNGSV